MHFSNGPSQNRMPPIGRDIHQRDQNESAFMQARMRQDQLIGRALHLRLQWQTGPVPETGVIGQDHIAHRQQIQIQHTRPPAFRAVPPGARLDCMQMCQNLLRRQRRFTCNRGVHKVGTTAGGETGGAERPADPVNFNPRKGNFFGCMENFFKRTIHLPLFIAS